MNLVVESIAAYFVEVVELVRMHSGVEVLESTSVSNRMAVDSVDTVASIEPRFPWE